MKYLSIFVLAVSPCVFAQQNEANVVKYQNASPVGVVGAMATFDRPIDAPVQGSPYSATITNESIQTLPDGNRIVQKSTGTIARDSQGRTRQDTALPPIGNLSAANAPHLVFIQDPVAQISYTLDLTAKTAQKLPHISPLSGGPMSAGVGAGGTFFVQSGRAATMSAPSMVAMALGVPVPGDATLSATTMPVPPPMPPLPPPGVVGIAVQRAFLPNDKATTEDLGSQTIEGVFVTGVRTTRTIPAGQIGNDKPISIVTEVWTSPDLKTIVSSKRTDPRMGEQTFQLTNVVRSEPDPSLFAVPADFKVLDGPHDFLYRTSQ